MGKITKSPAREIIDDFAKEIDLKKTHKGAKPSKDVIDFRREHVDGIERDVWFVPLDLLRYRKDNGRIRSDIRSYEKLHEPLNERSEEAQNIIRNFLKEKDPELNKALKNQIRHSGQRKPAIITCDGFLINGNRRKLALDELAKEDDKFAWMKVVILPGKNDPGGPPTLLEIEQIENRCQLQTEGKAEYYKFDRAISIRDKVVDVGFTLEDQLRDDPSYTHLSTKDFKKVVKEYEEEYLKPLECIDRYLDQLDRPGLYDTISRGISDREGRWQAFLDYYKHVRKKLDDDSKRLKMGINDDETGNIEEIAFKIIRKRSFPDMPKVHKIMRDFPKWLDDKDSKKELYKLLDIDLTIPKEDSFDKDGNEISEREKDEIWIGKYQTILNNYVKSAKRYYELAKEKETPITLLESALKKLQHDNMDPSGVKLADIPKAMSLSKEIKRTADELESEFYHESKKAKKLKNKFSK